MPLPFSAQFSLGGPASPAEESGDVPTSAASLGAAGLRELASLTTKFNRLLADGAGAQPSAADLRMPKAPKNWSD